MPRCIVQGCPHYCGRKNSTPGVTFFMFPKHLDTIKKWLLHINQNFGDLDIFAQGVLEGKAGVIRICSAHFSSECYHFEGSQRILLEDAVPTIFPSTERSTVKVETAVSPIMFLDKEKTGVKVEGSVPPAMFPKLRSSGKVKETAVPPKTIPEGIKPLKGEETSTPPMCWNVQPLQMPVLPFFQSNLGNPLWTNNGFPLSNLNPWSPNVVPNSESNARQELCLDTLVPRADDKTSSTTVDSHGKNLSPSSVNYRVEDSPNVQDEEMRAHFPDATLCEKENTCASGSPAEAPPVQTEDKAVQWPEYETRGLAWKVLHDHFYKVRTIFDRSSLKYGVESCYEEVESEGELVCEPACNLFNLCPFCNLLNRQVVKRTCQNDLPVTAEAFLEDWRPPLPTLGGHSSCGQRTVTFKTMRWQPLKEASGSWNWEPSSTRWEPWM